MLRLVKTDSIIVFLKILTKIYISYSPLWTYFLQKHEPFSYSHSLSFFQYTFQMESINKKTVHEELAKNLIFYLRLGADPTMIANILQVLISQKNFLSRNNFVIFKFLMQNVTLCHTIIRGFR